jgi:hypothetical protein
VSVTGSPPAVAAAGTMARSTVPQRTVSDTKNGPACAGARGWMLRRPSSSEVPSPESPCAAGARHAPQALDARQGLAAAVAHLEAQRLREAARDGRGRDGGRRDHGDGLAHDLGVEDGVDLAHGDAAGDQHLAVVVAAVGHQELGREAVQVGQRHRLARARADLQHRGQPHHVGRDARERQVLAAEGLRAGRLQDLERAGGDGRAIPARHGELHVQRWVRAGGGEGGDQAQRGEGERGLYSWAYLERAGTVGPGSLVTATAAAVAPAATATPAMVHTHHLPYHGVGGS